MKTKRILTPKELYKRNVKRTKLCKRIAPIVFWVGLGLGIFFLISAVITGFTNISEIVGLLDKDVYNNTQLSENYTMLIDKYGEWVIWTNGTTGITFAFINIANAILSGVVVLNLIIGCVLLVLSPLLGKWILPAKEKSLVSKNQDNVNLAVLTAIDKEK